MNISETTKAKILKISDGWDWDNYKDEKTDEEWSVLEALYCKLSWVQEFLKEKVNQTGIAAEDGQDYEEYLDIVDDTMQIVEALQAEIKI